MAIAITPAQLKAICPESPVSAVLPTNAILSRTASITHLRAAMVIAQLAASSHRFRAPEHVEARWTSAPFHPRGWIGLSGRRSYRQAALALDLDLLRQPELVDVHNVEVTAWFWNAHRLHDFSDVGEVDGCTRVIVGEATNERLDLARVLYHRASRVLAGAHELAA
jgi:predicted chitinase